MPSIQNSRHCAEGKRLVLIVDDEAINRDLLQAVLADEYETLTASDGESALSIIRKAHETLSLVLLDLLMPGMHGLDLLKSLNDDPALSRIPVIVLNADRQAEGACLELGAADFIPKPYPDPEVILARARRCVELSECRSTIRSTERDALTGLYNLPHFFCRAQQLDRCHGDTEMDAIAVDIPDFPVFRERLGKAGGDELLRRIALRLQDAVRDAGGIVGRRGEASFLIYCPHGTDHQAILSAASPDPDGGPTLRMGVYPCVDKTLDMERRFDRAGRAGGTARGSIGMFDDLLLESERYAGRLLEEFRNALDQRQFRICYQPKFDIRPTVPTLSSAEALVRWEHPTLGMISPAVFIPLLEDNGLIQQLDLYVWRAVAAQLRDWKARMGVCVPVSVNVSRVDMYDPGLADTFLQLMEEFRISGDELLLEITESAYTQDSEQIIRTVSRLRELGFRIELDDFGTGYSSLSMISALPIDALKLDVKSIRDTLQDGRGNRLAEIIIDIADCLSVPVIAEGVETQAQLDALNAMGCDLIQGYCFSKPMPAAEFERFMEEKLRTRDPAEVRPASAGPGRAAAYRNFEQNILTFSSIAQALAADYFSIYYVDIETDHFVEFCARDEYNVLGIEKEGEDFFTLSRKNCLRVVHPDDHKKVLSAFTKENLLKEMQETGTFTLNYRLMFGERPTYVSMKATRMAKRNDQHIVIGVNNIDAQMKRQLEFDAAKARSVTYSRLVQALSKDYYSIYMVNTETDEFIEYSSSNDYQELHVEQSGTDFFEDCRRNIMRLVYPDDLKMALSVWDKSRLMPELENGKPFSVSYRLMMDGAPVYINCKVIRMEDAEERNYIIIGVSNVDAQMKRERELNIIREKANRDALTGVKSKYAYMDAATELNAAILRGDAEPFAVVVCDVNGLKSVNDTLGHAAGDRLILDASRVICEAFQHSPVFRVGGDEFVAILRGSDYTQRAELMAKMAEKNRRNRACGAVVIACGESEWLPGEDAHFETVFDRADTIMYENKTALKQGR